jgi:predicted DCC family thiol-disulfide oxidoreductase YuxK
MESTDRIIFYDGDCGFCNRSVQFVLDHEKSAVLHFAALQSAFAVGFFERHNIGKADLSTFYFWEAGRMYSKSTGALRLLKYLRFPWPWLGWLKIVPRSWRDVVYDWVAKRRLKFAPAQCALPDAAQRKRFLG